MNKQVIQRFNNLSFYEQCKLVDKYCKVIHTTEYNDFLIDLCEIDCEFVEVWVNRFDGAIYLIRMPNYCQLDIHLKIIQFDYES